MSGLGLWRTRAALTAPTMPRGRHLRSVPTHVEAVADFEARPVTPFPFDRSFQEKVLRLMFGDHQWLVAAAVPHVQPGFFELRHHRWLAGVILNYAKLYASAPSFDVIGVELRQALRTRALRPDDADAAELLVARLGKMPQEAQWIRDTVWKFAREQVYKEAVANTLELMKQGKIDEIDQQFQRVLDVRAAPTGGYGHFYVRDAAASEERRLTWVPNGVPTGLGQLDDYIKSGGLGPKEIGIVVGPPSRGKTHSLINLMKSAVLVGGVQALYVSLEMREEKIEDKIDACLTGIKLKDLERAGNPRRIRDFRRELGRDFGAEPIVLKEFPARTLTVRQIESYVRSLQRWGFYPRVVFVDYADLLIPETGYTGNAYNDQGNTTIELRAMAQRLDLGVWTAAQGNKASLSKRVINMEDLADSFQKVMHADLILGMCQDDNEYLRNIARYFLMKNRDGIRGVEFPVQIDPFTCSTRALGGARRIEARPSELQEAA